MSERVGRALPLDLLALVDGSRPSEQLGKVVLVATIDDDGFPHTSLLSPGEILALDEQRLRVALFSGGHTLRNIEQRAKLVLVLVEPSTCCYVRAIGRPTKIDIEPGPAHPFHSRVVDVEVEQVFRDAEAGAWITTGARYARAVADDEELRDWRRVWDALRGS